MAALSASRNTPEWNGAPRYHVGPLPVEASSSLYIGGIVCLNSNGRAVKGQALGASPLDTLKVMGILEYVYAGGILPPGVDALNQTGNGGLYPGATATLGTAGAIMVGVISSIFGMDVDSSITDNTCIGKLAFCVDDHTVGLADGSGGTTVANTTSITVSSSAPLINVLKPYIQPGTFNAYSATGGGGTHYVENTTSRLTTSQASSRCSRAVRFQPAAPSTSRTNTGCRPKSAWASSSRTRAAWPSSTCTNSRCGQ